jgi:hypothetical protein
VCVWKVGVDCAKGRDGVVVGSCSPVPGKYLHPTCVEVVLLYLHSTPILQVAPFPCYILISLPCYILISLPPLCSG